MAHSSVRTAPTQKKEQSRRPLKLLCWFHLIIFFISLRYMVQWLLDNKVVEQIFGNTAHTQIIKRSGPILRFLASHNALLEKILDIVWQCATVLTPIALHHIHTITQSTQYTVPWLTPVQLVYCVPLSCHRLPMNQLHRKYLQFSVTHAINWVNPPFSTFWINSMYFSSISNFRFFSFWPLSLW